MVVSLLRRFGPDRSAEAGAAWSARPPGLLLWVHLGEDVDSRGLSLVLATLRQGYSGITVLATGAARLDGADLDVPAPSDTAAASRRFLTHWRPDAVLWSGSGAYPTIWADLAARDIPAVAVEADPGRHLWRSIRALGGFQAVLSVAPDPRFEEHVTEVGRLSVSPEPPKPRRDDFEALRERLETRPLWYAADVPESEIVGVLEAHARAAQLSHRLLLFLRPVGDAVPVAALDAAGWRWALRSEVGEPDPDVQILVADEAGEEALWLSLAPLTYLGGSLMGPGPDTSPLLPAALGSAVVHGDVTAGHADAISRLRRADATCRIDSFERLGRAVDELQSPDRVASLAHSAWRVTTEGAEASAALCEVLEDMLSGVQA